MNVNSSKSRIPTRRSLALAIGMALASGATQAGTIAVTTTDDAGPGSFREAIQTANANAGADIIDFSAVASGTITLASNLPTITEDLTLQGSEVTVDGDGAHTCLAAQDSSLAVEDMTITGCTGFLPVRDLQERGGPSTYFLGGGIFLSNGNLEVTNSTVTGNAPPPQPTGTYGYALVGGGIYVTGAATITDSVISNNQASYGGGILANGYLSLSQSQVVDNQGGYGGGIVHYGFASAPPPPPQVAGGSPSGDLIVSRSVISGNTSEIIGGGILTYGAYNTVSIDETEISGNQAGPAGGGLFAYSDATQWTVSNSTISGNTAQGGGAGVLLNKYPGTFEFTNNTISGNGGEFIAGLYLNVQSGQQYAGTTGTTAPVTMVGQTITGNTASSGAGGGLTAIFPQPTTVAISNSVVAGNSAAVGSADLSASSPNVRLLRGQWGQLPRVAIFDRGGPPQPVPGNTTFEVDFSLVGEAPTDGSNFTPDTVTGDLLGDDPLLGALADNGGPTPTHLPEAGSPVLDVVTADGGCGTTFNLDQRGEPRPEAGGTLCDAGSVERGALPPPLIDVDPDIAFGTVDIGDSAGPQAVTLANTGGADLEVTAFNGLAAPFTLDFADCGASLPFTVAGGESCTLQAGFSPTSAGNFVQAITVASNSDSGGDDGFELSGTAVAPGISATPLAFGGIPVGQTAPGTVSIENTGQGSLDITGLSLSDDGGGAFVLGSDTCGAPIAAGDSCEVNVDFTPSAAVGFTGSLAVENNATSEALEVAISGQGLLGNLVITPAGGLDFGDVPVGDSGQADLTLGNDGNAPLEVTGWPEPGAPFSIVGGSCPTPPFTLGAGESCTLTFSFAPADAGDFGETLNFSVDDGSGTGSVPVNVSGQGTAPAPQQAISVPTLDRIGLIIGGGLLALMGLLGLRRRNQA